VLALDRRSFVEAVAGIRFEDDLGVEAPQRGRDGHDVDARRLGIEDPLDRQPLADIL